MNKILTLLTITLFCIEINAQQNPMSTSHIDRDIKAELRSSLTADSRAANLSVENIGPTIFSGRVTDIDVNPNDASIFLVAYASGGLWKTENNGNSFMPLFDDQASMTIGDIYADWTSGTIWVGTGEVNSSRSSYAGTGIYKSTDWGVTWTWKGLPESHHISRVLVDPNDSNIVYVGVLGHLYSTNPERGVYKSMDGGSTWSKILYVDDNSGVIDLIMDPSDPNILYAASWDRIRSAWDFQEAGKGSGIHKSLDGGNTWIKVSAIDSGFPDGEGTGRIGLTIAEIDGQNKVFAIVDNYNRRSLDKKKDDSKLDKDKLRVMTSKQFGSLDNDKLERFLRDNGFPDKHTAESVKTQAKAENLKPIALVEYLETANSLLFDTPVIGAEVYVSVDGGSKWTKTHDGYLDGVFNSYGYYFGMIEVAPDDPNQLYIMGVPILRSDDGGVNWTNAGGDNVHADHHALWLNPNRPGHIINGNDGGINISYDAGENWSKCNSPAVGQFYYINADMDTPYNVYGGTQDNGVWVGSHNYREGTSWHAYGQYPYKSIMGGDGMQVQIDNRDNNTVYTGYQFGNYFRINKEEGKRAYITPKHELGDRPYRWNWQSPIYLSKHNQDILYMGSNKLHRSMNQGEDFIEISGDLTNGGRKGDVAYGTLTSVHESDLEFGLIYTGSDDGQVNVTKNGGYTWENINMGLPSNLWVSRIQASSHDKAKVYLSLNAYRFDDFNSYVYKSADYGVTWIEIGNNLPVEPVNVIKEDPAMAGLLYVGTDHGVYVSYDDGMKWSRILDDMPQTPVHDLVIQPVANDLLVGTHGRSIYKANVTNLRALKDHDNSLKIFAIDDVKYSSRQGSQRSKYRDAYERKITYDVYSPSASVVELELSTATGKALLQKSIDLKKGLASYEYDMSIDAKKSKDLEKYLNDGKSEDEEVKIECADNDKVYLQKGEYIIKLTNGEGMISEQTIMIK
ncbi:MAG: glycosyl hydrolase [Saprospiraceae bacterium]|nr:glycosyl hydrolase [Saprospiraceae bacterium]